MEAASTWDDLLRTGDGVRAGQPEIVARGRLRPLLFAGALASIAAAVLLQPRPVAVHADGGLDSSLFTLTNQDRASNGVGALNHNSTLQYLAENAPISPCGARLAGRSQDMINRNYFSHHIPSCGVYVFGSMQAYGIGYRSAGENIGWESGSGDAAGYINGQFMASPEHRDNILNANYTDLGTGSATSGNAAWSGGGGSYAHVWMFSEEFAQLGQAPPPPPPPPPATASGTPTRNSPAPPTPAAPPISTATPIPTLPPHQPVPTTPAQPQSAGLPLVYTSQGVISDAVLSVLEGYLLD
jgi:uncharacterized protein YkwD